MSPANLAGICVLGRECASEPPSGSIQTHRHSAPRDPQHRSELLAIQPLPGDQQQQLLISLAQRSKRPQHARVQLNPSFRKRMGQLFGDEPVDERVGSPLPASPVSQHPVRHPQQPRQRVVGHLLQTPPRDQEHVRDQIIRLAGAEPPPGEPKHRPGVR